MTVTYDHRLERTGHPVRSAIHKLEIGRLVVGWVTTSEYLLLYVLFVCFCLSLPTLLYDISPKPQTTSTYDHRLERTGHPVRSAIHKLEIGGLVVGWVTTSEYPLLYVSALLVFYDFALLILRSDNSVSVS
jgi:hypothetical protein